MKKRKPPAKPVQPPKPSPLEDMVDVAVDEYSRALSEATMNIANAASEQLRTMAGAAAIQAREAIKERLKTVMRKYKKGQ